MPSFTLISRDSEPIVAENVREVAKIEELLLRIRTRVTSGIALPKLDQTFCSNAG
jgi:hypothetical protein